MTIAESIERHIRVADAAVEWNKARERMSRLVTEGAPGWQVDAARRALDRREKQLARATTELQPSINVHAYLHGRSVARSQR